VVLINFSEEENMSSFMRSAVALVVLFGGISAYAHAGASPSQTGLSTITVASTSDSDATQPLTTDSGVNVYGLDGGNVDHTVPTDTVTGNTSSNSAPVVSGNFFVEKSAVATHPVVDVSNNPGNPSTSVPEPSTLALMLLASGGLFVVARKKQ
jgi:hypothetical protein